MALSWQGCQKLEAIAFNGNTAALHGRRQIGERPDLRLIDLPSSSGAFASMSRDGKRAAWMALVAYVTLPSQSGC